MSYSKKTIQLLSKAIDGDTTARKQLVEINQELAAFTDAVHGNKQAHHWLYDKGYYELSALLQTGICSHSRCYPQPQRFVPVANKQRVL